MPSPYANERLAGKCLTNIMKTMSLHSFTRVALVCLLCSFGFKALAASSGDLLRQAYTTLEAADHDYKGHRVAAMKQIEAAAGILGISLKGDGKGHEKQAVSDSQLKTAQGLLEQARAGLSGKALKHVDNALKQLSIALSIK